MLVFRLACGVVCYFHVDSPSELQCWCEVLSCPIVKAPLVS